MNGVVQAQALTKKVTGIFTAFVLAVSTVTAMGPFIFSSQAGAVGSNIAEVYTQADLVAAAADTDITVVSVKASIATTQKIVFAERNVYIDGNGNTLSFVGDGSGWQGNYVVQAYKVTLGIKNLTITGGDAALYANGSTVVLQGAIDVGGNEFGGIEVSQGSGVTTPAVLNASGAVITNSSEANTKPTAWIDHASTVHATVTNPSNGAFTVTTHIGGDQKQYYLSLSHAGIVAKNTHTGETFATIKDAIQDSDTVTGDTIEVVAASTVADATTVDKGVTLQGINGATVTATGGQQLYTITAPNVTIKDLIFQKTDTTDQNFIGVQANGATIENNQFSAQYAFGAGEVTRALVVSGGVTGLTVSGNSFQNIRQPAYIDNFSSGTISNNYVTLTRGWVIEKASTFSLTGNTWGTNATDIAIIPGVSPASTTNNYTCHLDAIKAANNNATIDDQYPLSIYDCPNTAPTVAFGTAPAASSYVKGVVNFEVTATDDYGMGSDYLRVWKNTFESGSANLLANCQTAPGAFALGKIVTTSCSYDTTSLPNGTPLVLSAQFLDGHNAWGQAQRTVYVDNSGPAVAIATPANGTTQGKNFTVNGTATDDTSSMQTVHYTVEGISGFGGASSGTVASGDPSYDSGVGTWSFGVGPLAEGYYRITVQATDAAGNTTTAVSEVFVDGTGPALTITPANFTTAQYPMVVGTTDESNGYVTVTVDGVSPATVQADASGNWALVFLTPFAVGSYGVTVVATDSYGNTSTKLGSFVVSVPTVLTSSTPDDSSNSTSQPEVATVTPAIVSPTAFASVLGTSTTNSTTNKPTGTGAADVKAASTTNTLADAIDTDSSDGTVFGLAWYWWLLIVAAVAGIIWWIAAAIRGRATEG